MFKRYAALARRAIFGAFTEAQAHGSPCIESEHLLLGILAADPQILSRMIGRDIQPDKLRSRIIAESWNDDPVSSQPGLPLSNECKRVLAYAAEEAVRLNHRHILAGHLLLGLLRKPGCRAAELLNEQGADLTAIRNRMAAEPSNAENATHSVPLDPADRASAELAADLHPPGELHSGALAPGNQYEGTFGRYNDKARRVIFFARFEASHWGRGLIEPEHLLLGILREGLWIVYALLGQENVWNDLIPRLRDHLGPTDPKLATTVDMPLSDLAQKILKSAAAECDRHGGGQIAIPHLLLALLDEKDSYPATLLREHGADPDAIRQRIATFRPGPNPLQP